MFFITFICSAVILIVAEQKGVEVQFGLKDIKELNKKSLILPLVLYIIGIIVMSINVSDEGLLLFIGISTFTFLFSTAQKITISKIEKSTCYKLGVPFYFAIIPIAVFLVPPIITDQFINEDKGATVAIISLIFSAIIVIILNCQCEFLVDEKKKEIKCIQNSFILKIINKKTETISFSSINYVKKEGNYYVINYDGEELKISKLFTLTKKLEKTLLQNGIDVN
jgi:hypothetical protein